MHTLRTFLRFTSSLIPYYVTVAVASVLVTSAGIAIPFIIGKATDTLVEASRGTGGSDVVEKVLWLAVAFLAVDIFAALCVAIGNYFGDVMSQKMRAILSVRYYEKLLMLPQSYFDNEMTGTITSRLNRSIMEVVNFVKAFSNMFFTVLLTIIAVLGISAVYSPWLALLLAIVFPTYLWLTMLTSRGWQVYETQKNAEVDASGGRFIEVVGQVRVVKSFVQELRELTHFSRSYVRTVELTKGQSRYWHRMDFLRRAFMTIMFSAIYAFIFARTAGGDFSIGDMVLLIQLVALARQPIANLSYIVDTAQRAIAGSKDYFAVMSEKIDTHPALAEQVAAAAAAGDLDASVREFSSEVAAPVSDGVAAERPAPEVAVSFEDVSFSYDAGADVLRHITFEVKRGERVAFVGESGGGKTTITSLLLGLYRPRQGRISVFGRDEESIRISDLRRDIGVVFQEASLFSGTVAENIGYARPDATRDEIVAAAQRANADVFIRKFPDGYHTVIGERGLKLSGGQKQRIAVARAILKDADILVLDEATSALDTRSERQVQAGLDVLMEGRTSLIIAHRLATIAEVDRIITLKDGRVDEIGTPEELSKTGGIYATLLALQSEGTKSARRRLAKYGFSRP